MNLIFTNFEHTDMHVIDKLISDHKPILTTIMGFACQKDETNSYSKEIIDFKSIKFPQLSNALSLTRWKNLSFTSDID